jgi:hypothetical protein
MTKVLHLLRVINRIAESIMTSALIRLALVLVAMFLLYRIGGELLEMRGELGWINISIGAVGETLDGIEKQMRR